MKIIIDKSIPFVGDLFEPYFDVLYRDGKGISREDVRDADALLIRSRTRCSSALLEGSSVRIISTASIGTDHIDHGFCNANGIFIQNAYGSNSTGVMNYVFSALYGIAARKSINLNSAVIGVIGVGNCGSKVVNTARHIGLKVLACDPIRATSEGPDAYTPLEQVLENSDIVTMHVPLSESTRKMAGPDFFSRMKDGAIFINTSRGEVVDDDALKQNIGKLGAVVIDTWNHEPAVDTDLMDMIDIATPHIAGYSYQGKQQGTAMAVRAIARFYGIKDLYEFFPKTPIKELEAIKLDLRGKTQGEIASVMQYNYPIFTDDFMFRMDPGGFERLRMEYKYRREFYID